MTLQQGDVKLFQTDDNGEINVVDGVTEMDGGLGTAVYLSLFGGNEDDDGSANNSFTYWGNLDEVDEALHQRSETQHLLQSLPATTFNLRRIEDAAKRDLSWFISKKVASSIEVTATIPNLNWVQLDIKIIADGQESEFTFIENWKIDISLNTSITTPLAVDDFVIPPLAACVTTWSMETHPGLDIGYDIKFNDDYFDPFYVACGTDPFGVTWSTDGINWTAGTGLPVTAGSVARRVAYSSTTKTWIVVGWDAGFNDHVIYKSTDGKAWTKITYSVSDFRQANVTVIWNNGRFLVTAHNTQYVLVSDDDGLTFTEKLIAAPAFSYNSIAAINNTELVCQRTTGASYYSNDGGDSWSVKGNAVSVNQFLIYDPISMLLVSIGGHQVETSPDNGQNWTLRHSSVLTNNIYFVATNDNGCLYTCGVNGEVLKSTDALTWSVESVGLTAATFAIEVDFTKWMIMNLTEYYTGTP